MKSVVIIEGAGALYTLQFFFYIPANGSTNPNVFQPKTFPIPSGIIPQNFSSLGFAVSEELGNIQTQRLTHSLTDWCFDREIISYLHLNGLKDILNCRRPRQFTYIFNQTKQFSVTYVETLNY